MTKKLEFKWEEGHNDIGQLDDCWTLKKQLKEAGYEASLESVYLGWLSYSGHMCAQWMVLNKDPAVNIINIKEFMEEVEE